MGILDNAKEVAKAVEGIHNLDLYQRVLNLHSDIIGLVEENNRLREENKSLLRTAQLKLEMVFKEPFYYREGDATPHCSACWEANDKPVHVTLCSDNRQATYWDCPSCKYRFRVAKKDVPPDAPVYRTRFGGPHSWMG